MGEQRQTSSTTKDRITIKKDGRNSNTNWTIRNKIGTTEHNRDHKKLSKTRNRRTIRTSRITSSTTHRKPSKSNDEETNKR